MLIEKLEKDIFLIAVLVVLFVLELLVPYFDTFKNKLLHTFRNLGLIALNAIIVSFCLIPFVALATGMSWGVFARVSLDWRVEMLLTIVLIDALTYVMHVLNHKWAFLWRFHRVHHADTEMDVTTGARFHIGEHFISTLVRCCLYAVFAIKLEYLVIYEAVFLANVLFHHANLSVGEPLDKVYRIFFTSPNMHKVHHSDIRDEMDTNYTSLLSVWDRVFGTFCIVEDPKRIVYGVKGMADEQTIGRMFTTPFRQFDSK